MKDNLETIYYGEHPGVEAPDIIWCQVKERWRKRKCVRCSSGGILCSAEGPRTKFVQAAIKISRLGVKKLAHVVMNGIFISFTLFWADPCMSTLLLYVSCVSLPLKSSVRKTHLGRCACNENQICSAKQPLLDEERDCLESWFPRAGQWVCPQIVSPSIPVERYRSLREIKRSPRFLETMKNSGWCLVFAAWKVVGIF